MALLLRTGRGNGEIDAGEDDPRLLSVHPACNNPDAISQVILGLDENAPTMTVFVRGAAATRRWGGRISPATEVHLTRYIELGQGFRYGQSSYSALCKHASHAAQSVKPIRRANRRWPNETSSRTRSLTIIIIIVILFRWVWKG